MTRDGKLIINYDTCLREKTNAVGLWDSNPDFVSRQSSYEIYPSLDKCVNDYSVPNFDLDEIRKLNRKQHYPNRPSLFDNMFKVMTLDEGIKWIKSESKRKTSNKYAFCDRMEGSKKPGINIVLKNFSWYESEHQMDLAKALFENLQEFNIETVEKATAAGIPVII